jgi:hypothetical protein
MQWLTVSLMPLFLSISFFLILLLLRLFCLLGATARSMQSGTTRNDLNDFDLFTIEVYTAGYRANVILLDIDQI